jgi:hypothetical protein
VRTAHAAGTTNENRLCVHVMEAKHPRRCSTRCRAYVHPSLYSTTIFMAGDGSLCAALARSTRLGSARMLCGHECFRRAPLLLADSGFWSPRCRWAAPCELRCTAPRSELRTSVAETKGDLQSRREGRWLMSWGHAGWAVHGQPARRALA